MPTVESNCSYVATMKAERVATGKCVRAGGYGASSASLIGGVLVAFAAAAGLTELPDGPNRELVSKVCQSCHDLQMVLDAAGSSRADWNMSLDEMTANGMNVSAGERAKIIDYLSTYLGPSRPPDASRQ
jgi:cytochrome c5